MSFTLCTSGQIIVKAGKWASSTATASGQLIQQFCDEAEGEICAAGRYDFVTNYSALSTKAKDYIQGICAAMAAFAVVDYDTGSFPSIQMATSKLDVLDDKIQEGKKKLAERKTQDWLKQV